jgi:uncharacterized membrane protein YeaQ/YmgE (transglycosylase-associated protein family)
MPTSVAGKVPTSRLTLLAKASLPWMNARGAMRSGETMENEGIGWIAAIIIGGLAGWFASKVMKSNTGLLLNIVLGIVGAVVASFLFNLVGFSFAGWIGYLIAGFIGACILIGGARAIRG